MLNSYRLIESTRYQIPDNLCFTSDKPLKDVKQMIYYILFVGSKLRMEAISRRDFDIGTSEEPLGESVCYLLQEFYEVTLHPYENFSIPIDLYCLWNWSDPDVDKRNGLWIDEKEYFVPGLAERVTQILRGDIVPYMGGGFPWSDPTSNGDDPALAMQGRQDKGLSLDQQEHTQAQPSVEELEQSYSAPDATYLNHGDMGGIGVVITEDTEITGTEVEERELEERIELDHFVGSMEDYIVSLPTSDQSQYSEQIQGIKTAKTPEDFKDRVNDLSRDLYAKSYDAIQHDIAMFTEIADGVTSVQPENITQQIQELGDTQGTGMPSVPISQPTQNIFWITHEASYIKSRTTCITTTRSITQALNDCYYILCEGYEIFDDHCEGRISDLISDCEPLPESVCHLLVKYYGYEICEYDDSATEIDLLYIWQGPRIPEIRRTDKTSELWRNLTRFRPGFYPELFAIIKGEIATLNMPQYPWIGKYSCITGWVAGGYILELPFGCFNTEEEALQFGRLCHAIQPCQEPSSVMWLRYWDDYDLERISFQISDLTVYKKPDGFVEGGYRGYEDLEPADVPAQEIPIEEIGTPAYMYSLAL